MQGEGRGEIKKIALNFEDGNITLYGESQAVFPFCGWPMLAIDKEDECSSFYIEFKDNEEIDKLIAALENIKYKNKENT